MFKEMFLQTSLTSQIFSVITFTVVSETVCGTTNIVLETGLKPGLMSKDVSNICHYSQSYG